MESLSVLLNIAPYEVTQAQRTQILSTCPGAEVRDRPSDADLDRPYGYDATILVSEDNPRGLSRWPRLRFVQLLSAGISHLDNHPIWKTDIPVATASGIHGVPMAQFATGALLMLVHRMAEVMELKSTRKWPDRCKFPGYVLRGLTVGIIGYGSIGRECARQLHAMGMRVLCMKRDPSIRRDDGFNAWPGTGDQEGHLPERWFAPQQLREMLPHCDALVVTAPRTKDTQGMVGKAELALLKPKALVIVISRGGIIEETALAAALRAGQIAGAAVDCFLKEPISPQHPLFDVPQAILTPHMSGVYDGYWPMAFQLLRENLCRLQGRQPLLNLASWKLGY